MNKLISISLLVFAFSCSSNEKRDYTYPEKVNIEISDAIYVAGEDIEVKVNQIKPQEAYVYISNGIISFQKPLNAKATQTITLSSPLTDGAGLYKMNLIVHDSILASTQFNIEANEPTDPIEIYAGPRSINVDQTQQSMVVAVPQDQYNNPVRDGTPVNYSYQIENKKSETQEQQVKDMLAYQRINADTKAKDAFIGVSHIKASSRKQKIISTPSWPENLIMMVYDFYPYANNRNLFKIETNELVDSFGNRILDGTLLKFHVYELGKKVGQYNGICIDGKAFCYIKNPSYKTDWTIKASIGDNIIGQEIELNFLNDLEELIYKFSDQKLIVGPLRGQLGQYVSEGTSVELQVGENTWYAESLNGVAQFDLKNINWDKNLTGFLSCAGNTVELRYE